MDAASEARPAGPLLPGEVEHDIPVEAPSAPGHPLLGMGLFVFGVLVLACMDVITKTLVADHPAPLVVGVRYMINCLLLVALLGPSQSRSSSRPRAPGSCWRGAGAWPRCRS
jgi:hypothetical protein